jgi:hypothetical protein
MKILICELCKKDMGEIELGKIRNHAIILCKYCWDKAKIAIEMAEMARSQAKDYDMPDFMKDLFK